MNRFRSHLLAAIAFAGLALASVDANAAAQIMCQGDVSGASTGARQVVVTSSTASPQPTYNLNSGGCALIQLADIGFFQSLGFTPGTNGGSIIFNVGVATGTTDFVIGNVPAGAAIRGIYVQNSVAAAVTGGISFGTTANGTDVVAALAVASSGNSFVTDALTLKRIFPATGASATQALHAAAVTAWNSTNCTITVTWEYF